MMSRLRWQLGVTLTCPMTIGIHIAVLKADFIIRSL